MTPLEEKGIAVGYSDIRNDAILFRFMDEKFVIPTADSVGLTEWNGYWYEARVKDLRKFESLKKEAYKKE